MSSFMEAYVILNNCSQQMLCRTILLNYAACPVKEFLKVVDIRNRTFKMFALSIKYSQTDYLKL